MSALSDAITKLQADVAAYKSAVDTKITALEAEVSSSAPAAADLQALADVSAQLEAATTALTPAPAVAEEPPAA